MKTNRLAFNTAYLLIDWFGIFALSFLFWVISGKFLPKEQLGIVSTSVNLAIVISGISLLGLGGALIKLISEYTAIEKQKKKIGGLIKFSLKIVITSSIVFSLTLVFLSAYLSPVLKLSQNVIVLTAMLTLVYSICIIFGDILYGFQKMKIYAITDISGSLVRVVSSAALIFIFFSYFGTEFGYFGPIIGSILCFSVIILLRSHVLKFSYGNKVDSKEVFSYSFPYFISGIAIIVFSNTPYVILTLLKDLSITGIFTPAMLMATPIFFIPYTFAFALFPVVSQLSAKRNSERDENFLIRMTIRFAALITVPLAVILAAISPQIIQLLFSGEYLEASKIFKVLVVGALLYGLGGIFLHSIYALKRPKVQRNIFVVGSILFLSLSIVLVSYFWATGIAIAYLIAASFICFSSFFYLKKLTGFKFPTKDLSKIILSAMIAALFTFSITFLTSNLLLIVLSTVPALLIYFLTLLYLRFYKISDIKLMRLIASRTPHSVRVILLKITDMIERHVK